MDFNSALSLINDKAPSTPIREAIILAQEIVRLLDNSRPTAHFGESSLGRTEMCNWIDKVYGPISVQLNKIQVIKGVRNQFKIGLKEAKDTVDWYIEHPDPMFW